jgi:hypothetical protein
MYNFCELNTVVLFNTEAYSTLYSVQSKSSQNTDS